MTDLVLSANGSSALSVARVGSWETNSADWVNNLTHVLDCGWALCRPRHNERPAAVVETTLLWHLARFQDSETTWELADNTGSDVGRKREVNTATAYQIGGLSVLTLALTAVPRTCLYALVPAPAMITDLLNPILSSATTPALAISPAC